MACIEELELHVHRKRPAALSQVECIKKCNLRLDFMVPTRQGILSIMWATRYWNGWAENLHLGKGITHPTNLSKLLSSAPAGYQLVIWEMLSWGSLFFPPKLQELSFNSGETKLDLYNMRSFLKEKIDILFSEVSLYHSGFKTYQMILTFPIYYMQIEGLSLTFPAKLNSNGFSIHKFLGVTC